MLISARQPNQTPGSDFNPPVLGAGLGYRSPFKSDLFLHRSKVDFLEITADHFLDAPPEKIDELDLLAAHFPLIPHGLNLSLGSAEGLDPVYAEKLANLIHRLRPPWWSEHIAFTRAGGIDIGHLSPAPLTEEALDVFCRNIAEVQRLIPFPLILENITYQVALPGAEMQEADFLGALLRRAGCGLLLDVANLHTNCVNHRADPADFLDRIPLERVVQLHFAGGFQEGTFLIDSHSHGTPEPVWALLETVMRRAPVRGVILERDENLPPFGELLPEIARARALGQACGRWS